MTIMKTLFYFFTLTTFLLSCNKDYDIVRIQSDIIVSSEKVNNDVVINAETDKQYSTLGHEILFCNKTGKSDVLIEFKKIKSPHTGLTALGPAKCSVNLGRLESGEYDLTFKLNKTKTKGKLIVGDSTLLTIEQGGNVKL